METLNLEKLPIHEEQGNFLIPRVDFDPYTEACELSGESFIEDSWQFYENLINRLKNYMRSALSSSSIPGSLTTTSQALQNQS